MRAQLGFNFNRNFVYLLRLLNIGMWTIFLNHTYMKMDGTVGKNIENYIRKSNDHVNRLIIKAGGAISILRGHFLPFF